MQVTTDLVSVASLTIECVLLLQKVFSYCVHTYAGNDRPGIGSLSYYRMCSLTTENVRLL